MAAEELRSVRIEVDGAPADSVDIAESQPRSDSKWVLLAGLLVVLAIGAALISLSPSEDQAADGTQRLAPTTTLPEQAPSGLEQPAEGAAGQGVADTVFGQLTDLPSIPIDVVAFDDGLIAVMQFASAVKPGIFQSSDGLTWTELDTTVSNPAGVPLDQLIIRDVLESTSELAVVATPINGVEDTSLQVLTSTNGVDWVVSDTSLLGANAIPFAFRDGSIVTNEFVVGLIGEVVATHTDLTIPGGGCSATGDDDDREFRVTSCDGQTSEVLVADRVVSDAGADAVLNCVGFLNRRVERLTVFTSTDPANQTARALGSSEGYYDLLQGLVPLASDRWAFFDPGSTSGLLDTSSCNGVIPLPESTPPSVVIIDDDDNSQQFFEAPFEPVFPRVLGETRLFRDQVQFVLVSNRGDLWALDPASGEWLILHSPDEGSSLLSFGSYTVSESGSSIYQVDNELINIIRFRRSADGEIEGSAEIMILELEGATASTAFFGLDLPLIATEELILGSDRTGQVWALRVPRPTRGDRAVEVVPDQGGVGAARVR